MFEQDYIIRLVREIARVLAKIIFHIDSETITEDLKNRLENGDTVESLLDMIDEGRINEAENRLYDILHDGSPNSIETALLFYTHLNDKSDEFLKEHEFSREEVKMGIESVAGRLGLSSVVDAFLMN